ncbi:MAG: hypothetical protein B6244_00210 [Candidatus Cloacimonetes bacterium 4572_55]|nr:MAG: hypothetical protein B6244_00210 [Candidatus Cloacimonetes bacterium 4572_55]
MAQEKILFADDDTAIVKLVSTFLKFNGYDLYTAIDGQTAYKIANEAHPDLVISDVMMPKMSGFDLCRRLRENALTWHIPIMLLSARNQTIDKVHGLEEGANDYMTKPFELDEILARVKALLKRSKESMDANPSTKLPGNISIEKAIVHRINSGEKFAVCYCDLDNFKAFNDHYGFYLGDSAIKFTGLAINRTVHKLCPDKDAFVGHIGGDDFIFICRPEQAPMVCQEVIDRFDKGIRDLYDKEDLERGYVTGKNRQGITIEAPIMSISIAVITNTVREITHPGQISMIEGELKEFVKKMEGSAYLVDNVPRLGDRSTIDEILIAHHDRDFSHRLRKALSGFPFTITLARNGAETLYYGLEKDPALLILDPNLDIINGWEVFHILRKNEQCRLLPILFFATRDTYKKVKSEVSDIGVSGILLQETEPIEIAKYFGQILDLSI